jgi:hypothetical protein
MNSEGVYARDPATGAFLRLLRNLPAELALKTPVLRDIADLSDSNDGTIVAQPGLIRRRLDRRYARIRVVHAELGKLDFKKAASGTGLEDMVFAQTDFDMYKKISREDLNTFFDEGLDDFEDAFYKNNFMMDRGAAQKAISHWYQPKEEYYSCAVMNPLLLGIMCTLHTSLEFAPLITAAETLGECEILIRFLQSQDIIVPALGDDAVSGLTQNFPVLFSSLIRSLDKVTVIHPDGMATTLSIRTGETSPVLYGTFHPDHKAHTIPLT